jgi:hypothetical protein
MSRIISYKGKLADGAQESIPLQTINGMKGYRIVKFQIMGNAPGTVNYEHIVKIYKTQQAAVDGVIDFSDNRLLAAAFLEGSTSVTSTDGVIVIFDNEIFNQDIYITHTDIEATSDCNYYIELEQMKLDLNEQTVATLKDIRNVGAE